LFLGADYKCAYLLTYLLTRRYSELVGFIHQC